MENVLGQIGSRIFLHGGTDQFTSILNYFNLNVP